MINSILNHLHDSEIWSNYRPRIPRNFYYLALYGGIGVMVAIWWLRGNQVVLANLIFVVGVLLILPIILVGCLVYWIRNKRLRNRNQILDVIAWRGDERVLDVGCGSGLLLNGAAQRLTSGKAIGIDIWVSSGGGGDFERLWQNVVAEGVTERVEFKEVDVRQMPFEDEMFDVVLSNAAMHHVGHHPHDKERALSEMIRVLKPGGYIVLRDVAVIIETITQKMAQLGLESEIRKMPPFLHYAMSLSKSRKPF